jgi:lysophospholipase L1-like esterase
MNRLPRSRFFYAFLWPILASISAAVAQPASALAPDLAVNPAPAITGLDPALPTLWIAGDSTAARGRGATQQGWGVPFADYFDPAKINIANRARGGRSSRTFVNEGLWEQLLADVKKGDTVLLQFGHNDGGPINTRPARGSLPGLGDETQDIESITTNRPETVHTFGWYLRKMIADVKARGATPIVLSLTLRNVWNNGKIERGSGRYSHWSYEIAKSAAVPFIDLMNTQGDVFDALGEPAVKALYPQDHTHFNAEGADLHAATVVALLKGLRPSPVAKALSAKGEAVVADKLSWLRLPRPTNPSLPSLILVGDSTVRNGRGDGINGQWGWGDFLGPYFDAAKLNVVNRAVGGTGARSFGAAGYWDATLALVKPGDVVMIQFGHNDNGPRGPLRGTGAATEERENPITKEKETVLSFGAYLRRYVADIRAKQATPILCSLVPRKIWKDGKIARTANSHADWTREVAAAEHVAVLDLHETIASRYDALGEAAVSPLFADERVHTTRAGAELNAECVIAALRTLPQHPLAPFLFIPLPAR